MDEYISMETMIEPLRTFFVKNNISPNSFYVALRYPLKIDFIDKYEHLDLLYKGKEGIPFFENTVKNLSEFKLQIVKLGRSFEV